MPVTSTVGLGNHIENKDEIVSHSFDIFSSGTIEKAMERGYECEIRTTTSVTNEGPYEFIIPPSSDYIYLPQTRLQIQGKITTAAGANPADDVAYSTANLFPQTLFRQVDVHVGGMNTAAQDGLYAYKAFFETLFSYSSVSKNSHLKSCSGWVDDTAGQHDTLAGGNTGYTGRRAFVAPATTFDFCIPLHADIFQCGKLVPPRTQIKIVLYRNNDLFSLMSANAADLKINIKHLSLFIRRILPNETLGKLYDSQLEKKEVILPFSRSILKRDTVATGTTNVHLPLFNGEMPRQILMAMVDSTRLDGSKSLNPFKFGHFNVRHVNLRINGMSEPGRPYEPDFTNHLIARELRALYDNTGILTGDSGFAITRSDFEQGKTFFAWDLTPDHCNGYHIHEKKIGKTIDLDLVFNEALPNNINVLIYATYETHIKLLNGMTIEANFVNG